MKKSLQYHVQTENKNVSYEMRRFYANSWITSLFTSDPSVLPFTFGITAVITLPISALDVAPTSEITCLITFANSSSVNCSGKYALKI